jgi:hypothetical protein
MDPVSIHLLLDFYTKGAKMKQKFKYNSDIRNELGIKKGEYFTLIDRHLTCIEEELNFGKKWLFNYAYTVAFDTELLRGSVRVLPHNDWIELIALSVVEE